ncbi:hypothetical protein QJQ45_008888 [Haematococcus lacustris]|nr:hypothetical protein QJQ45_008888 [Haematococcus lacustris]
MARREAEIQACIEAFWRPGHRFHEGDALSQALMGALILIVKKPDDLLLRHTWYLFKLRDRIIKCQLPASSGELRPHSDDQIVRWLPLRKLYLSYKSSGDGSRMPDVKRPEGRAIMELVDSATKVMPQLPPPLKRAARQRPQSLTSSSPSQTEAAQRPQPQPDKSQTKPHSSQPQPPALNQSHVPGATAHQPPPTSHASCPLPPATAPCSQPPSDTIDQPQLRTSRMPRPPMRNIPLDCELPPLGISYSFFQEKGLGLFNVPSDGNCFYHASCVWQGRYGKDGHLETRARTVDLTKALVKLFQEELQASTCSPALVRFMLESAFTEGSTVPMPLAEWYPVHLEQLGSWTNETALLLHSMLLGVPIYVLDRGTRQQRPWHRVSITTSNMEQLTAEQVARIRPPGYPVGQPGEAMYLVRCNDNHWLALGNADGSRLRDGEVDVLKLSEEVGLVVWKHTNTMGKAWHHGQSLAPC